MSGSKPLTFSEFGSRINNSNFLGGLFNDSNFFVGVAEFADAIAYRGFDPREAAANFIKLTDGRTNREIANDISHVVLIGLKWGNIRSDQLGKTGGYRVIIEELVSRYGIHMRKNVRDKKSRYDALTFARALSVFPIQASVMIRTNPGIIDSKNIRDECGSSSCPAVLKHSGAANLIPKSDTGYAYLLAHVAFMLDFCSVINPASRGKPIGVRYEEQMKFAKIASESDFITEVDRVAFFKTVGLDSKESYDAAVRAANALLLKIGEAPITETPAMKDGKVIVASSDDVDGEAEGRSTAMKIAFNFTNGDTDTDSHAVAQSSDTAEVRVDCDPSDNFGRSTPINESHIQLLGTNNIREEFMFFIGGSKQSSLHFLENNERGGAQ